MQTILYYLFSLASSIFLYTNAALYGAAFSGASHSPCLRSYFPLVAMSTAMVSMANAAPISVITAESTAVFNTNAIVLDESIHADDETTVVGSEPVREPLPVDTDEQEDEKLSPPIYSAAEESAVAADERRGCASFRYYSCFKRRQIEVDVR